MPGKDHVTMKFTKGHNSVKSVGGVKVLVLCTLSDNALYLYQVFSTVSQRVSDLQTLTVRSTLDWSQMLMDRCTENWIPISRYGFLREERTTSRSE